MIATTNARHEAGMRKAAILVSSLDPAAADLLLDQLDPERADLVRRAAMTLDNLDAEEQQRVIDEFRRIGPMVPQKCPPGIELDRLPAAAARPKGDCPNFRGHRPGTAAQRWSAMVGENGTVPFSAADTSETPFSFLCTAEEEKLAQLLGAERPQTIALVLSNLPPDRAGEVLSRLAPPLQVEVVRRLVDSENTDPETMREVEQALEARLSRQFASERRRAAGPEVVAKILAACDGRVAGSILDNLAAYDRPLAARLGCLPLQFDDIVQLDDAALLAVFRAAEPEVAQAALLGATPQLVEKVLRCMASEEAKGLRRKLSSPGPIRLSDVEDARRQIAALAQRMSHSNPPKPALAA